MKVLVISAHPDDETIGAGGTIARHIETGDSVYWCVVTQGHSDLCSNDIILRSRQQVLAVQQLYGIKEVFFCGYPSVQLNIIPQLKLCSSLHEIVSSVMPEIVYTTPSDDINQDHRIVHDCTLIATRPLPSSSVRRLLSYEICTTTRFGIPSGSNSFYPTVYVDISKYIDIKLKAMSVYSTELHDFPHPRSLLGIELFAKERGISIGVEAAECFKLVREIIK